MLGKGLFKRPASDPERIREACENAQRVLLCMTDLHIGNFAISTPAIKALQRGLGCEVDVVVARVFVPLAERLIDPAMILAHDAPKTTLGDIAGLRRTRRLTKGNYDLFIGLSGGIRGSTLAMFSGVKTSIGLDRYRRSGVYSLRIADQSPAHAMDRYGQFGICAGGAAPIIEPFRPMDGDAETLQRALEQAGIDPANPLTVFHPGAGKAHRRWPVERFARVADHVVEEHGHTVGILTPPGEEAETEAMLGAMNRSECAHRVSFGLGMLMPLFDHSRALVCNESGPMHLASMTSCAIVSLFGPTDPARWSPIRTGPEVAVLRGDACKPECKGGDCVAQGACLTSISVDKVIRAFDQTLSSSI